MQIYIIIISSSISRDERVFMGGHARSSFASWVVRVTDGDTHQYTFTAKKTGASVTNHKFECRLVGNSETAYVLAAFKGSEKAVATAKAPRL